jgi:hypothetical protein
VDLLVHAELYTIWNNALRLPDGFSLFLFIGNSAFHPSHVSGGKDGIENSI